MEKDLKFSVAMSIYKNDDATFLRDALRSTIDEQTLRPSEIVITGDGPLPDTLVAALNEILQPQAEPVWTDATDEDGTAMHTTAYVLKRYPEVTVRLLMCQVNRGLGEALRTACNHCTCSYIARMDSDDLCLPDRFEKQMQVFADDAEVGLVGGMITEFVGDPANIVDSRLLPLDTDGIYRMMRTRSGVNHVTVVMRKSDLMAAGNYNGHFRQEDFYLWARMMKNKVKMRNISDVVVNVRSGADQFARRGGMRYFHQHMKVFRFMYSEHLISLPMLLLNYVLRFMQVALPTNLRTWVYQNVLRSGK